MSTVDWTRRSQQAVVAIAVALGIGALHLAKSAIAPVLFAVFFAILLSPAVAALCRLRVPRSIGAAIVVASLVAVSALAFSATWRPARDWLDTAPATMRTLEIKLRPVVRFVSKLESVSEQAGRVTDPITGSDPDTAATAVVAEKSTIENTQEWLLAIATTLVATYFLLASGPRLLDRVDRMFRGAGSGPRLRQIATTIGANTARYFAALTLSNLLLGIGTVIAMHSLGMPSPLLWGMMAFVLNYVPYAGSATTLVLLTCTAIVSFDGLGRPTAVAGCYLALATFEGQVLQPFLVGRRLDVSPLIVFLSLWFGGWLWGITGVALAVPTLIVVKALLLELQTPRVEADAATQRVAIL